MAATCFALLMIGDVSCFHVIEEIANDMSNHIRLSYSDAFKRSEMLQCSPKIKVNPYKVGQWLHNGCCESYWNN